MPIFDFHERIVRGSRNSRIADALCGDLYHLLRIYRRRSGAVPGSARTPRTPSTGRYFAR